MKPNVVTTQQAQYDAAPWNGVNESGAQPIGDSVLVLPDEAAKTIGSKGLLIAPEEMRDRMSQASESGVIVALGDDAFYWNADRTRPYGGAKPKAGDRVYFQRYSGQIIIGDDGLTYRVMTDNCVGAISVLAGVAA